jgi:hypothetical protein
MNILEKFIEIFKNCIIILSGYEKLHLSEYATNLSNDFGFELIEFKYPDFESLNKAVKNSTKQSGIIIYGLTFPSDKLEFKANYHISLSANKTLIDDESQFSIYNQYVKENFINKFKNLKSIDYSNDIYDDIYEMCIDFIKKKVYGDKYEEAQKKYLEDSESESENNQITSVKDDEDDTPDIPETTESSGGSRRSIPKLYKGMIKRVYKKGSKKISKKGSKNKPKKVKRIIGTRLLKKTIKI